MVVASSRAPVGATQGLVSVISCTGTGSEINKQKTDADQHALTCSGMLPVFALESYSYCLGGASTGRGTRNRETLRRTRVTRRGWAGGAREGGGGAERQLT